MVQESLIEYINRLLRTGYPISTIRDTLIKAGYDPKEVERSIRFAQKGRKTKIVKLSAKTFLITISVLIVLILLVIGGIKLFSSQKKMIELGVMSTRTEFYAGQTLTFVNEFYSEQESRANVLLVFEVIDRRTNTPLATAQEMVTVGHRASVPSSVVIPQDAMPGSYVLQVTASFDDTILQESFNFMILEKSITSPAPEETPDESIGQCPSTCDDYNKCTEDFCEKGMCRHRPLRPCCGNGVCENGENRLNCIDDCRLRADTPQEITEQAMQLSLSDAESAAVMCSSIGKPTEADVCFSQIALSSNTPLLCDNVGDSEAKDRCYVSFALEGDYSVCNKVKDSYLSKACYSLQRTEELKAQAEKMAQEQGIQLP